MNKLSLIFALGAAVCCSLPAQEKVYRPFDLDARPARSIVISEKKFAEFLPGTKNLEIVLPQPAIKTRQFAAQELKTFLDKRLATSVPIVSKPTGGKYAIILGQNEFAKQAGIDDSKLCRDGFIIRTIGKNIYIVGRDTDESNPWKMLADKAKPYYWMLNSYSLFHFERATLFGVYDFLERFAGIRFYFPTEDFTVIPKGKMTVPEVNIFDRPDFESRYYSIAHGAFPDGVDKKQDKFKKYKDSDRFIDSEKVYHYLRTRMETQHFAKIHGIFFHYLPKRYGKTHPQYQALLNPKGSLTDPKNRSDVFPCLSHGAIDVIKQDVRDYFQGKKKLAGYLPWVHDAFLNHSANLAMPDAYAPCKCAECAPHFKSLQKSSDHIWKFTADVANMVKAEKLPGYITQLAYDSYSLPPSDNIKLPDNIWVYICTGGPWDVWSMDALEKEYDLIKRWYQKTGKKNCLWNYSLKYGALNIPDIPNYTPRAFAQFYKLVSPYVNGVFNETKTDHYFYAFMNYYMLGKVTWDTSIDADKIMEEHFQLLYGKGAPYMQAFFDELENLWLRKVYKTLPSDASGPRFSAPSPKELWTKIYSPAKLNELRQYLEKASAAEAKDPQILRRIAYMKKIFFDITERAAKNYLQMHERAKKMEFKIASLPAGNKITIDGKAEESIWNTCEEIYVQGFSLPASVKQETTTVKGTIDGKNLYLLFKCTEADMKNMKDYSGMNANQIELYLQNAKSGKSTALQVILNSKGELFQLNRKYRRVNSVIQIAPIADLTAAVKKYDNYWMAEVQIPLKAIPDFDGSVLYGNFCRQVRHAKSRDIYSWIQEKLFYIPTSFGKLILPAGTLGKTVHAVDYNQPAAWQKSSQIQQKDGLLIVQGRLAMTGPKFKVDPAKTYTLALEASAQGVANDGKTQVFAGFQAFDEKGREIRPHHVSTITDVLILTEDTKPGTNIVKVKGNLAKLKDSSAYHIVFGAKEDLSDLPNWNIFASSMQKVEKNNDTAVITFRYPIKRVVKAGTPVRVHATGGYLFSAGTNQVGKDWQLIQGSIKGIQNKWIWTKFPVGTAQASIIILSNWNSKAKTVQYKNISLTER